MATESVTLKTRKSQNDNAFTNAPPTVNIQTADKVSYKKHETN